MFKRTNEETLPREYKKPSDLPLFANIDDRKFEVLEEKSPPPEFSSKLVEKSLIKNKVKANDSLCGLAPANFKPKEETPETEKDSSTPAQEAKSEDNAEENKEAAREEGYQEGFTKGKKEGSKIGKELGIQVGKKEGIDIGKQEEQPKIEKKGLL